MLDILGWIDNLRSISIYRSSSNLYKKYRNNLIAYDLKNIYTTFDAVKILKRLTNDGYISCDGIMERLCYLYSLYLPTEVDLSRLSLLHQSVIGTRGIEEYSTLILWTSAIQSIMDAENKKVYKAKIEMLVCKSNKISIKISIIF